MIISVKQFASLKEGKGIDMSNLNWEEIKQDAITESTHLKLGNLDLCLLYRNFASDSGFKWNCSNSITWDMKCLETDNLDEAKAMIELEVKQLLNNAVGKA